MIILYFLKGKKKRPNNREHIPPLTSKFKKLRKPGVGGSCL
jgi:hypothetical protein